MLVVATDPDAPLAPLLRLPTGRAVWLVAWPMIAIGLLKTAYYLTDTWFVSRLGDAALSAMGGSAFAWWMILLAGEIAGTGTHALVARHEGAGDGGRIGGTLTQGLWVGLLVAVAVTALWPLRGLYFDLLGFGSDGPERALGLDYLGACLLGTVAFCAHAVTDGVFRGLGDTRTALVLASATFVANALLDPLLIWGLGPVPALGIAGAAWATALARAGGALLGLWVLARRGHVPVPTLPDLPMARRITAIGLPVSARGIAFSLVYVALGRMITSFGPEQMAALGVGHRLESVGFMVCVGFEVAAATLVGQHLGARDPVGALRAANIAARMCAAVVIPVGVVLFAVAEPLYGLFATKPETIAAGVLYLRLQAPIFGFLALESVYEGGFSGSGRPMPSLWIGATGTILRLPLAWALAFGAGFGIGGIWLAIALSTVIKGVAMWAWFQRSHWARPLDDLPGSLPVPARVAAPTAELRRDDPGVTS